MEITLDANEVDVVGRTLRNFLGDLRMEISNTEKYDLRQSLKADEDAIKQVLTKLGVDWASPTGGPVKKAF